MKIIVSHDIDHWKRNDHLLKDLYLQKQFVRSGLNLLRGRLSPANFLKRMKVLTENRMERLNEVLSFDEEYGIIPTCFVGYDNALGLSYSESTAKEISQALKVRGTEYFPHGIAYDNKLAMKRERDVFLDTMRQKISPMGIRMHYLRHNANTYSLLKELGYDYCSNAYYKTDLRNPYWVNGVLEFPVCMMEVYEISFSENDPKRAIQSSIKRITDAEAQGLEYFTLIFHDNHYADAFWQFREWYHEVIRFMASRYEFTSFSAAYNELKN